MSEIDGDDDDDARSEHHDAPILSYAFTGTGPLSSDLDRFVFRAPLFVTSLLFNSLVACFFAGAAITIGVTLARSPGPAQWQQAFIVLLVLFGACVTFGWQHWNRAAHLIRFGGLPITMTFFEGQLILIDPPQWGVKAESVLLYDVTRLDACLSGWSLLGPTIYRVKIFSREGVPLELRVRSSEAAAMDDALALIRARLPSRPRPG